MPELPLLVFAGVATEDSIAVVDEYPSSDERVVADSIVFGGGGPAATAAVAAARLGMRTAVVSSVGDDEEGSLVRERLAAEGVDVSGIRTEPGATTSRSVVVISGSQRERAIINQLGPALNLRQNPVGCALVDSAAWVHVDQHGWEPVRRYLAQSKIGVTGQRLPDRAPALSIDAGNPIPGLELSGVRLYAPTLEALSARYGEHQPVEVLLQHALDEGAKRVVVTDGGRGSYAADTSQSVVHVDAPESEIRSTLGAGDVFHGALLAAHVYAESGELVNDLRSIIAYATTVATLSCRGIDGRSNIPDHEETLRHLASRYDIREV